MRAMTVQQPWAWAIIHGGKNVENRSQPWSYRGPLAIHAGSRLSDRGMTDQRVGHALQARGHIHIDVLPPGLPNMSHLLGAPIHLRAVIGVVDLTGAHWAEPGCCDPNPWAEEEYTEHGGRTLSRIAHLVLENACSVPPIPCDGHLGLWRLPADILAHLEAALDQAHDAGCPCGPDGPADSPAELCACYRQRAKP